MEAEVEAAQTHFSSQRSVVKDKFDRLQQVLDKRRQEILTHLQQEEDDVIRTKRAQKAALEEQKASLATHAGSVERWLVPAPGGALLGMLHKLKERLDSLEKATDIPAGGSDVKLTSIGWEADALTRLEQAIGVVGRFEGKVKLTHLCRIS